MLEVTDLNAFYGRSHVLQGISLSIAGGEVVSLLGRNGVGRSTALKAIIGEVSARGSVKIEGTEVCGWPTHRIARCGVGYVPESRDVFPDLTVHQNLRLGVRTANDSKWSIDRVFSVFPRLAERRNVAAGSLSGGEQQMLTMGRSLVANPRILLVDEPTEGLAPKIVEHLAEVLLDVAHAGIAVLLVEQKLAIALTISNRVLVMGRGKIVFESTPADLSARRDIMQTWMAV